MDEQRVREIMREELAGAGPDAIRALTDEEKALVWETARQLARNPEQRHTARRT